MILSYCELVFVAGVRVRCVFIVEREYCLAKAQLKSIIFTNPSELLSEPKQMKPPDFQKSLSTQAMLVDVSNKLKPEGRGVLVIKP